MATATGWLAKANLARCPACRLWQGLLWQPLPCLWHVCRCLNRGTYQRSLPQVCSTCIRPACCWCWPYCHISASRNIKVCLAWSDLRPTRLLQYLNAQGPGGTGCCLSPVPEWHAAHCRRLPAASCKPLPRAGVSVPVVSADTEQRNLQQAAGRLQPICSNAAEGCCSQVRCRTAGAADRGLSSIIGCCSAATQGHD